MITDKPTDWVKQCKFLQPVVFDKKVVDPNGIKPTYNVVLFSFQSTGPTNIITVNSVLDGKGYVRKKVRGHNGNYFQRFLEDNPGRTNYCSMYCGIDNLDAAIKRSKLKYRCRKYYHNINNHTLSMALATAYSFYEECAEGDLDPQWKVPKKKRMTKQYFQQRLGEQMMMWLPELGMYPTDKFTRPF